MNPTYPRQSKEATRDRIRKYRSTLEGRLKTAESQGRARAKDYGVAWEVLDYQAILEREGRACYLCGGAIDLDARSPSPDTLAFFHRMPIPWGGPHLEWNVHPVHLRCHGLASRGIL